MEDLLLIAGGISLLLMGFFRMKGKVDSAKAEASIAKTNGIAEKLEQEFKSLNEQADALRNKKVAPTTENAEEFWKSKLDKDKLQ